MWTLRGNIFLGLKAYVKLGIWNDEKTALLALLVLSPLTANADIHKCIINGHTTYQDAPCARGGAPLSNSGTLSTLRIQVHEISSPAPRTSQRSPRPRYNRRSNSYQSITERRNAEVRAARGIMIPIMSERPPINNIVHPSNMSKYTYIRKIWIYFPWNYCP